ncbi:SH3 domain containing protein [Histomonas meleagridis]|uniref:SH3 domain containing protein n=1 Tax=Histomonas meleagridis TaxID=135588 RepID=UPI00355A81C5|nr:SH3 domain containing protein [Histomonas meleagridis]KAH0800525.1 SH3 domain containing protein [Histomonas meleagridis]
MAAASFKTYPELIDVLRETKAETLGIYQKMIEFFNHFTGNLEEMITQLTQFTAEYSPKAEKKQASQKGPHITLDPNGVLTELGKAFPHIASTSLAQIPAFTFTSTILKEEATQKLEHDLHEYDTKFTEILDTYQKALDTYTEARNKYDKDYKAYVQSGESARNKGNKKLVDVFVKAKKTALESHAALESVTAETSLKMEQILTEYEDLEMWRSDKMQQFILNLAETLKKVATKLSEGKAEFFTAIHHVPINEDVNKLKDFSFMPSAEADPKYQMIYINPAITHLLKPEQLYPDDVKQGKAIYKLKRDYTEGPRTHLKAKCGDLVVGVGEEGDCFLCKDVNECVALIPKTALEKVN